jgi:hypothetical protein
MITEKEWKIIKICLENAPTPYDVGHTKVEAEELLKKIEHLSQDDALACLNDARNSEFPPL